jgi:RNA polymerase subunit RPABC4/transcription elongation factor Spt4
MPDEENEDRCEWCNRHLDDDGYCPICDDDGDVIVDDGDEEDDEED